jgi:hypothetical protein
VEKCVEDGFVGPITLLAGTNLTCPLSSRCATITNEMSLLDG